MTKWLGIDYGLARVGLATSEHTLATPLTTIENSPLMYRELLSIIKTEGITEIVCGLPEGALSEQVVLFGNQLQQHSGIQVILHPETLSSKEAITKLREGGAKKQKLMDDHVYAACLILEDYLDLNEHKNDNK